MLKRQYICFWGEGYTDTPRVEVHEHTWFLESRGYTADNYDQIFDLAIGEKCGLSDLSGIHWVMRIEDVEYYSDERTTALYTAWISGKLFNNVNHTIRYPDTALISMSEPTYTVLIGNQELQTDNLDEAERWLWNNYTSTNKSAGQV